MDVEVLEMGRFGPAGESGYVPSSGRVATAVGCGRGKDPQGVRGLLGDNSVAQSGELSRSAEARCCRHPAGRQPLHPLHEARAQATRVVRGRWCRAGCPRPARDRRGVTAPRRRRLGSSSGNIGNVSPDGAFRLGLRGRAFARVDEVERR